MANWLVLSTTTCASLAYSVLATGSDFYENELRRTQIVDLPGGTVEIQLRRQRKMYHYRKWLPMSKSFRNRTRPLYLKVSLL